MSLTKSSFFVYVRAGSSSSIVLVTFLLEQDVVIPPEREPCIEFSPCNDVVLVELAQGFVCGVPGDTEVLCDLVCGQRFVGLFKEISDAGLVTQRGSPVGKSNNRMNVHT